MDGFKPGFKWTCPKFRRFLVRFRQINRVVWKSSFSKRTDKCPHPVGFLIATVDGASLAKQFTCCPDYHSEADDFPEADD